ncbi:cytidine deaminase [Natranaerobius trueperi]|uniref:cytidine deaminase n=1 Tax=Natranaerobius trueperi TaxID=759412 RepID=UPI003B83491F
MSDEQIKYMIDLAEQGKDNAYVPYSKYPVGASIMTGDGEYFNGCNVENASFGLTNCAERTAIFKAVSESKKTNIKLLAVIADSENFASPCGACRQVIMEFGQDAQIILANKSKEYRIVSSEDLLPGAFTKNELE